MGREGQEHVKYILTGKRQPSDQRVVVHEEGRLHISYADLNRDDSDRVLTRRRWQILDILVGDRGKAFTSEELAHRLQEVFPDSGLVKATAIASHISTIRSTLVDDASDPGFIVTEAGAYRLCAKVELKNFEWSLPATVTPLEPSIFARYWRLATLAAILLSVTPLLLLVVAQPFKVKIAHIGHGEDPVSQKVALDFPESVECSFDNLPPDSRYGFTDISLFHPATVTGEVSRSDNTLYFEGTLEGLPSGCVPTIRHEAPEAFPDDLTKKVADEVFLQLDWEACVHPLRTSIFDSQEDIDHARARHCLVAGRTLRWRLRYCEAKDLLLMAIDLNPGLHEAWTLLGNVHENTGADLDALEILKRRREATEDIPETPYRLRLDRQIAQLEGRYDHALEILERLNELTSQDVASLAWFHLAYKQDCEKALEILPDDHGNKATEADFHLACGRPQQALPLYDKHYENRGDVGALYSRAHGKRLHGRYCQAKEDLTEALARDSHHSPSRLELINLLDRQGLHEEALQEAENLLQELTGELSPTAIPITGAGCLRGQAGQVEPRLCRPRTVERDARIAAALLYRQQDPEAALAVLAPLEGLRQSTIDSPHLWSLRALWAEGLAHLSAGDKTLASQVVTRMGEVSEARLAGGSLLGGHYLHHLKAQLHLMQGRPAQAVQELKEIFRFAIEERAFFHTELAFALWTAGDWQQAREELESALGFEADFARARCLVRGMDEGPPKYQVFDSLLSTCSPNHSTPPC